MDISMQQAHEFARRSGAFPPGSSMFRRPIGTLPASPRSASWTENDRLAVARALMAAYEAEYVFLPDAPAFFSRDEWRENYDEDRLFSSHVLRYLFEREYFSNLHSKIEISDNWDEQAAKQYIDSYFHNLSGELTSALVRRITAFPDPRLATDFLAIQLAADFLVESSAMIRNIQGYYGPAQSEFFKIIIDEYGYGVHDAKHSTLYKRLLHSIGLPSYPHYFFSWYLPTTLLISNYYNRIATNHKYFFYYIGAVSQIENSFVVSFPPIKGLFDNVYGGTAETTYFGEHIHIDKHHGRMAVNDLFFALIREYGCSIVPDLLRGFEESILLSRLQSEEFIRYLDVLAPLIHAGYQRDVPAWIDFAKAPTILVDTARIEDEFLGETKMSVIAPGLKIPSHLIRGRSSSTSALLVTANIG